ncbi:hypothetical protein NAPIS_ORF01273 [Vairimorpha apis BRL 01]|uniref:Uncharacterized protein n=1 Tax=Vairimorpha apis BRL 01 TaxID=1037528 RepID=T0L0R9_9MICR|nr:hypothetical protein NAPIS_ORF01273 [Vairimorpha apis BRL 01]
MKGFYCLIWLLINVSLSKKHHNHRKEESCSTDSESSDSSSSSRVIIKQKKAINLMMLHNTYNLYKEYYCKYYTEDLKNCLLGGISSLNKNLQNRLLNDFSSLENEIPKIIELLNSEILREIEGIITNANIELQENTLRLVRTTLDSINAQLLAIQIAGDPITINLADAISIVDKAFVILAEEITQLFRRITAFERSAINKLIDEKLNNQIRALTNIIENFKRRLGSYFKDIEKETLLLIKNNLSQATNKFTLYIDELLKKMGQSIVAVLRDCGVNFQIPINIRPNMLVGCGYKKRLYVNK